MKKVYIIHGWSGYPEEGWFPWVKSRSDNDLYVPCEETKKDFEEKLGAKVIVEHAKGHFSGEDNVVELPAILDFF